MLAEPSVLVLLLAAAWAYGRGVRVLWLRAGPGRGVRRPQVACFAFGLVAILVALESPLDALSADLFAAHMVQHLILMLVAAPLLVLGAPLAPMLWALPDPSRHAIGRGLPRLAWLSTTASAFGLQSAALWLWHLPALYEAALSNRAVHALEHGTFLVTALLFWWSIRRASPGAALSVFGLAIQSTVLGALLTFGNSPWYHSHLTTTARWGLTPLEDQQLAGLIMWIPGGLVYLGATLFLLARLLRDSRPGDDTLDPEAHTLARR